MPSRSMRLVNGEAELEHLLGKVDEAVTISRDAEAFFEWEFLRPEAERSKTSESASYTADRSW